MAGKKPIDKKVVVQKIVAQLAHDMERLTGAARAAHAEATDPQSKAENKYDTRGLEAAYLAGGQARKAAEIEEAIKQFQKLRLMEFVATTPIDLSAMVELKSKHGADLYFVGPQRGGLEVEHAGREITVITPESPIGQQIVGRRLGDRFKFNGIDYEIAVVL